MRERGEEGMGEGGECEREDLTKQHVHVNERCSRKKAE